MSETPHSALRTPHSEDPFGAVSLFRRFAVSSPEVADSPLDWKWSSPANHLDEAKCWRIRVPMRDAGGVHRGYAFLERRLEKERVLFQVASLLDTFGIHFPTKLYSLDPAKLSEYLEGLED